jgi:hypothetical protein
MSGRSPERSPHESPAQFYLCRPTFRGYFLPFGSVGGDCSFRGDDCPVPAIVSCSVVDGAAGSMQQIQLNHGFDTAGHRMLFDSDTTDDVDGWRTWVERDGRVACTVRHSALRRIGEFIRR